MTEQVDTEYEKVVVSAFSTLAGCHSRGMAPKLMAAAFLHFAVEIAKTQMPEDEVRLWCEGAMRGAIDNGLADNSEVARSLFRVIDGGLSVTD